MGSMTRPIHRDDIRPVGIAGELNDGSATLDVRERRGQRVGQRLHAVTE